MGLSPAWSILRKRTIKENGLFKYNSSVMDLEIAMSLGKKDEEEGV